MQREAEAPPWKSLEWWWAGMWESSLRAFALELLNVLAKAERGPALGLLSPCVPHF